MSVTTFFPKTPRKTIKKDAIPSQTQDASLSDTEELSMEDEYEQVVRVEVQDWLAQHGSKLFALAASQYLAREAKRKNLRELR